MANSTRILSLLAVVLMTFACTSPRKAQKPDPVALFEKVAQLSESSKTTALVSYAFLYSDKAPSRFLANRNAKKQAGPWARLGPFTAFVSRPAETGLPMSLERLTQGQPEAKSAAILTTKSVLLARYYGPKLGQDTHVVEFARFARSVAEKPNFVLDLSTRRVLSISEFEQRLANPATFLSEQVIPGVERAENGTITFYTRGMAKFGLPDLEQTEIKPEKAKAAFKAFQKILLKALEEAELKLGSSFEGFMMVECQRPKNAIEQNCLNLKMKPSGLRED
jgi:hypothetical protein